MAIKKHQVYLSSTQQDAEMARSLFRALKRFRVPRSLPVARGLRPLRKRRKFVRFGREEARDFVLPKKVLKQIRESQAMVLLCSPSSSSSQWTRTELEAYYDANPVGKVIPILVEGDPENSFDRNALSNPAFPENLAARDAERWIDARMLGWDQTAPSEVIAELLEVPVAQLSHHATRAYSGMSAQRRFLFRSALGAAAVTLLWLFGAPLHEAAKTNLPGYGEHVAPLFSQVSQQLADVPLPEAARGPLNSAAPKTVVEDAPPPPTPQGTSLEPTRLALVTWLNRAETLIPYAPKEAMTWLASAERTFGRVPEDKLHDERFRYHLLSAVAHKNLGAATVAEGHLLSAIEFWAGMPASESAQKEEMAFDLFKRIGSAEGWQSSAVYIFNWITKLKGNEKAMLQRGRRLIQVVDPNSEFVNSIDGWLNRADTLVDPPASNRDHAVARFTLLRVVLAEKSKKKGVAVQMLTQGQDRLRAAISTPGTALEQALLAQYRYRELQLEGTVDARTTAQLERLLPVLRRGAEITEWQSWFQPDLAKAWEAYADYHFKSQSFAAAADAYETAFEFVPDDMRDLKVETLLKAGCAYRYSDRHADAWNTFRLALSLIPENAKSADQITALMGASLAASELKKEDLAQQFKARAISITANDLPNYRPPEYWREPFQISSS